MADLSSLLQILQQQPPQQAPSPLANGQTVSPYALMAAQQQAINGANPAGATPMVAPGAVAAAQQQAAAPAPAKSPYDVGSDIFSNLPTNYGPQKKKSATDYLAGGDLLKQLQDSRDTDRTQQAQGIQALQEQLDKYNASRPQGTFASANLTPLAAFVDSITGSKLAPAAESNAKLAQARDLQGMALGEKLQNAKAALASGDTNALGEQVRQQKADQQDAYNMRRADAQDARLDKTSGVTDDRNFSKVEQMLEQLRGSPAAQQAEKNHQAAQTYDELTKKYNGNLDALDPQEAKLAITEIARMASNGVPSEGAMKELDPNTIQSHFAGMVQSLTNDPSPANLGAFLKRYGDYVHGIDNVSKANITDRYSRILTPWKGTLGDKHYSDLENSYVNRFAPKQGAAAPSGGAPEVGTVDSGHVFLGGDPSDPKNWKAQ